MLGSSAIHIELHFLDKWKKVIPSSPRNAIRSCIKNSYVLYITGLLFYVIMYFKTINPLYIIVVVKF